jgi:hypothetical protein
MPISMLASKSTVSGLWCHCHVGASDADGHAHRSASLECEAMVLPALQPRLLHQLFRAMGEMLCGLQHQSRKEAADLTIQLCELERRQFIAAQRTNVYVVVAHIASSASVELIDFS